MLLHDTMLNDDSYRTGTSVTPLCECGLEEKLLITFYCDATNMMKARNILMDSIKYIWISYSLLKLKQIVVLLRVYWYWLLHMMTVISLTKKAQKKINGALFEFLASVDRNL